VLQDRIDDGILQSQAGRERRAAQFAHEMQGLEHERNDHIERQASLGQRLRRFGEPHDRLVANAFRGNHHRLTLSSRRAS
jgi:hypothetical protein